MSEAKQGWRCRFGFHRWTVVPESMWRDVGHPHPDIYVGRTVPAYCIRCGVRRFGGGER